MHWEEESVIENVKLSKLLHNFISKLSKVSSDTGIVRTLREFHYWVKKVSFQVEL